MSNTNMSFDDAFSWLSACDDFDTSISLFANNGGADLGILGIPQHGYGCGAYPDFPSPNSYEESSSPTPTISHIDPRVLCNYSSPTSAESSTPSSSSSSSPTFTPTADLYQDIVAEEEAASKNWPRVASGYRVTYDRDGLEEYLESEGGTDDEYLPSPVLKPVKAKSKSKVKAKAKAKPSRRGASEATAAQGRSRAAPYPTPSSSRNPRAKTGQIQPSEDNPLQCPHCPHYQKNGRGGDLRRHIRTHFGKEVEEWVCCGNPSVDGIVNRVHNGVPYAEGCGKTFTRRDALRRHILHQGCATGLENLSRCRVVDA